MNVDDEQKKIQERVAAAQSAQDMEDTEDYLKRGRPFQHLTIEELGQRWTNGLKAWVCNRSKEWQCKFADSAAEFRLRGADPPFETVRDEIDVLSSEACRDMSERRDEALEVFAARIAELLSKRGQSSH